MSKTIEEATSRELLEEVLRRIDHVDAMLALVREVGAPSLSNGHAPEAAAPKRKGRHVVKSGQVVEVLREAGRPLTAVEIMRKCPRSTEAMIAGHLKRGTDAGLIEKVGLHRPFAYKVVTAS